MAELGAVAAGLQITGQIFSLIKDLHNLKKGFTEAKTKHQSDLIEVQNILKGLDYSTRSFYWMLQDVEVSIANEISENAGIPKMLEALIEKAQKAKRILENCQPTKTMQIFKFLLKKDDIKKIKDEINGSQTTLLMVLAFIQIKIRQPRVPEEIKSSPAPDGVGTIPDTAGSEIRLNVDLQEMEESVKRAVRDEVRRITRNEHSFRHGGDDVLRGERQHEKKITENAKENTVKKSGEYPAPRLPAPFLTLKNDIGEKSSKQAIVDVLPSPLGLSSRKTSADQTENPIKIEEETPVSSQNTPTQDEAPSVLSSRDIPNFGPNQHISQNLSLSGPHLLSVDSTLLEAKKTKNCEKIEQISDDFFQDQNREEPLAQTEPSLPGLQPLSEAREKDIFWDSTSFTSVPFGNSWTMIFFQNDDSWIQCGLIPADDEDEEILLEPVVQAARGSPMHAEYLDSESIRLFYASEDNGYWILCEQRLDVCGELPFPWSSGNLRSMGLRVAPSSEILVFGPEHQKYLAFEQTCGSAVYLRHDCSEDKWTHVTGRQGSSNFPPGRPLFIRTEEREISSMITKLLNKPAEWEVLHHFYCMLEGGEITLTTILDWPKKCEIKSVVDITPPYWNEGQRGYDDRIQCFARSSEDIALFRSNPSVVYFEFFHTRDSQKDQNSGLTLPKLVCTKQGGTQFHFSSSLRGVLYISECGKMEIVKWERKEETRYRMFVEGEYRRGRIEDLNIWLNSGWTLERPRTPSIVGIGDTDDSAESSIADLPQIEYPLTTTHPSRQIEYVRSSESN